jgi:hypothetical protein
MRMLRAGHCCAASGIGTATALARVSSVRLVSVTAESLPDVIARRAQHAEAISTASEIASSAYGLLAMTAESKEFRSLLGGLAMRH